MGGGQEAGKEGGDRVGLAGRLDESSICQPLIQFSNTLRLTKSNFKTIQINTNLKFMIRNIHVNCKWKVTEALKSLFVKLSLHFLNLKYFKYYIPPLKYPSIQFNSSIPISGYFRIYPWISMNLYLWVWFIRLQVGRYNALLPIFNSLGAWTHYSSGRSGFRRLRT